MAICVPVGCREERVIISNERGSNCASQQLTSPKCRVYITYCNYV